MGSNPAGNNFFHEISMKVYMHDHLTVEAVH